MLLPLKNPVLYCSTQMKIKSPNKEILAFYMIRQVQNLCCHLEQFYKCLIKYCVLNSDSQTNKNWMQPKSKS